MSFRNPIYLTVKEICIRTECLYEYFRIGFGNFTVDSKKYIVNKVTGY